MAVPWYSDPGVVYNDIYSTKVGCRLVYESSYVTFFGHIGLDEERFSARVLDDCGRWRS